MIKFLFSITAFLTISTQLAFTTVVHGDGKYQIDVANSSIQWTGEKFTGEHSGNLSFKNGEIVMGGHGISSANFVIDMTTIDCTDLKGESAEDLESHLRAEDFFYTKKFPEATITLVSANAQIGDKHGNNFDIRANLTIKGITHEISFPAQVKIGDKQVTLKAKVIFDRTKWGIHYKSKSLFDDLGDKFIYDDIELNISLIANAT